MGRFHTLRLMADDMTGALDSAAAFVPVFGPLRACFAPTEAVSFVLDTGTRERTASEAATRIAEYAKMLFPAAGRLSFFKVDSLLRGHAGAELIALLAEADYAAAGFDQIILAPAMPFQGRITRGGRQHIRENGEWRATGEDIAATLRNAGIAVHTARAGEIPRAGITFFDAETEADLDAIAQTGLRAGGNCLWVGSGGLAAALARALGGGARAPLALSGPMLGLIGSHHPVMRGQLAGVHQHRMTVTSGDGADARAVTERLARDGAAFVTCALDKASNSVQARARIETVFGELVTHLPKPGLLFASGGETLRGLIEPLGADSIEVFSQLEPGAPLSRFTGGAWNGGVILSKSGAFGAPDFLATLLNSLNTDRKALTA